jgi:transposase
MGKNNNRFSPEVQERSVRLVAEPRGEHESQWAAICAVASKIGCTAEMLQRWVHQAEWDTGKREALTTNKRERLKQLEKENRDLSGFA